MRFLKIRNQKIIEILDIYINKNSENPIRLISINNFSPFAGGISKRGTLILIDSSFNVLKF